MMRQYISSSKRRLYREPIPISPPPPPPPQQQQLSSSFLSIPYDSDHNDHNDDPETNRMVSAAVALLSLAPHPYHHHPNKNSNDITTSDDGRGVSSNIIMIPQPPSSSSTAATTSSYLSIPSYHPDDTDEFNVRIEHRSMRMMIPPPTTSYGNMPTTSMTTTTTNPSKPYLEPLSCESTVALNEDDDDETSSHNNETRSTCSTSTSDESEPNIMMIHRKRQKHQQKNNNKNNNNRHQNHHQPFIQKDRQNALSAPIMIMNPNTSIPSSSSYGTTTTTDIHKSLYQPSSSSSTPSLPSKPLPIISVPNSATSSTTLTYYMGSTSLQLSDDELSLSPLHCFMRKYCVEAFTASSEDVTTPRYGKSHGRSIMIGQVGIQCIHCKHRPYNKRQERAVCFPSTLKNIYHSIETWQRRHSLVCTDIPTWAKEEMTKLMGKSRSGAGGRRQYWEESAMMLGMIDTDTGIRFIRPPGTIIRNPTTTSTTDSINHHHMNENNTTSIHMNNSMTSQEYDTLHSNDSIEEFHNNNNITTGAGGMPLVHDDDQELVTDFLFCLLNQMETCYFSEQDRVGGRSKVKDCSIGYPGLQCKHCGGKAGFGRYFPISLQALTSANSDRNIYNHVEKCRRCPTQVRDQLQLYLSEQQSSKNRRGNRKLFFQRVWDRMHGSSMVVSSSSSSQFCNNNNNTNMIRYENEEQQEQQQLQNRATTTSNAESMDYDESDLYYQLSWKQQPKFWQVHNLRIMNQQLPTTTTSSSSLSPPLSHILYNQTNHHYHHTIASQQQQPSLTFLNPNYE